MDRILIILKKKENGPRASSVPALGLNTIIFKYVYWYVKQSSGERLQDHWSSGFYIETKRTCNLEYVFIFFFFIAFVYTTSVLALLRLMYCPKGI